MDKRDDRSEQHAPFQIAPLRTWNSMLPPWLMNRPEHLPLPAPITLLLIAAVLGLAVLSPWIARNMRMAQLVVAAIVGLAGLLVLQRWTIVGFLALIPVSLVIKYAIGTGSQTGIHGAVVIVVLLIGLWVLDMFSRDPTARLLPYRPIKAAFIFMIVSLVAFGFGQFHWFPIDPAPLRAQIGGLGIFLLSAGTMLVAAHRIRSIRELEWIVWLFLAFGGLYVLIRTVPFLRPYYQRVFVREAAQGSLFYVWLASLGVAQVILNTRLDRRARAAIVVMLLGLVYLNMGVSRDWVSGWLPPLVGVFVVVFLARPQLGIGMGILGGLAAIFFSTSVLGVFTEGDNTYSYVTRLEAWGILWEIIKVSPVFGLGMANYYWYTPLYSILGYRVNFNSHNNYIDLAAQTGIVGVLCFLLLFWELWRATWSLYGRAPEGFEKAYAVGALGGLIGTIFAGFLGDWIVPFVYNIGLGGFRASLFAFLFLGGALAITRMLDEKEKAAA